MYVLDLTLKSQNSVSSKYRWSFTVIYGADTTEEGSAGGGVGNEKNE